MLRCTVSSHEFVAQEESRGPNVHSRHFSSLLLYLLYGSSTFVTTGRELIARFWHLANDIRFNVKTTTTTTTLEAGDDAGRGSTSPLYIKPILVLVSAVGYIRSFKL